MVMQGKNNNPRSRQNKSDKIRIVGMFQPSGVSVPVYKRVLISQEMSEWVDDVNTKLEYLFQHVDSLQKKEQKSNSEYPAPDSEVTNELASQESYMFEVKLPVIDDVLHFLADYAGVLGKVMQLGTVTISVDTFDMCSLSSEQEKLSSLMEQLWEMKQSKLNDK